jgi:hypothetical protein
MAKRTRGASDEAMKLVAKIKKLGARARKIAALSQKVATNPKADRAIVAHAKQITAEATRLISDARPAKRLAS